jgi:hypothetical protein
VYENKKKKDEEKKNNPFPCFSTTSQSIFILFIASSLILNGELTRECIHAAEIYDLCLR